MNFACLSVVCSFVSNKRQNGWTDRPKFGLGPLMTPGKINGWSKFQILAFNKIRLSLHLKIHEIIFIKSANFFCFCFTMYTKRKCWHWKRRWPGAKRPESPVDHTFAVILSLKKLCYQLKMFNLLKIIFKFSIFYLKGL